MWPLSSVRPLRSVSAPYGKCGSESEVKWRLTELRRVAKACSCAVHTKWPPCNSNTLWLKVCARDRLLHCDCGQFGSQDSRTRILFILFAFLNGIFFFILCVLFLDGIFSRTRVEELSVNHCFEVTRHWNSLSRGCTINNNMLLCHLFIYMENAVCSWKLSYFDQLFYRNWRHKWEEHVKRQKPVFEVYGLLIL